MTHHESQPTADIPELELTPAATPETRLPFGTEARMKSEALLTQHGKPAKDDPNRLEYAWSVGWEFHRIFTLSRDIGDKAVDSDTRYSLLSQDKDSTMRGNDETFYYSERIGCDVDACVLDSPQMFRGVPPEEVKEKLEEEIINNLNSEAKKDTGYGTSFGSR